MENHIEPALADIPPMRHDLTTVAVHLSGQSPVEAEHAGYGKAPDIRVDHPDVVASRGQSSGEVDRDRRLAHAALAGGDGQYFGCSRDGGIGCVFGRVLPCNRHGGRLLFGRQLGPVDLDPRHSGERLDPSLGVTLDLGPEWTARRGQGDRDGDEAVCGDNGPLGHSEIDDVRAEFGVDHTGQHPHHVVFGGQSGSGHDHQARGRLGQRAEPRGPISFAEPRCCPAVADG